MKPEFFLFIICRNKHEVENKERFWNGKKEFFQLIICLPKDKIFVFSFPSELGSV